MTPLESGSARAASEARSSAQDARSAAKGAAESAETGVRSAGLATKRAAAAGWDTGRQTVVETADKGRRSVRETAGKVGSAATTAWTAVKQRKAVAVGAAAGIGGLVGGAFALGRQTATSHAGPLTRLTGGRI
ncbi:hypothetical protein ACIRD6_14550 [Streptomyces sp. NPDC102473]|uniref:hypothetical protein n=1 Tax=unclassified Streptomyces TaxID=2593676 RepID=UPI003820BAE2